MSVHIGDTVQAAVVGSFTNGGSFVNVWHMLVNGITLPATEVPDAVFRSQVEADMYNLYNNILPWVASAARFDYIKLYNLTLDAPMGEIACRSAFQSGRPTSEMTGHAMAILIAFQTGVKHKVGKKFIPGVAESQAANGLLPTGAVTAALSMGVLATTLRSSIVGSPACTWIYGVRPVGTSSFAPFVSARVTTVPGNQRRRRPGVGS